jgi:hypothetical protein
MLPKRAQMSSCSSRKVSAMACSTASALLLIVATKPAFSCQFLDVGSAIAGAMQTSLSFYIATAVGSAALVAIELYRKRTSALSVLSLALLVFHPYWWYEPSYMTSCQFPMVTDSQIAFGIVVAMLAIRLLKSIPLSRAGPG